jgi:hypothetical protein
MEVADFGLILGLKPTKGVHSPITHPPSIDASGMIWMCLPMTVDAPIEISAPNTVPSPTMTSRAMGPVVW